MIIRLQKKSLRAAAFSLIEVVLAMGIFLLTVLTLVGLMGPALKSVSTVKSADEVASVVDSVNAFLNHSPYIKKPIFESIYNAVEDDGYAELFVFRWYDSANDLIRLEIGFNPAEGNQVDSRSHVEANNRGDDIPAASFGNATSSIYRVVLTASSAMLTDSDNLLTTGALGTYPQYTLSNNFNDYRDLGKSYLALEVRIFAEDPSTFNSSNDLNLGLNDLANKVPVFTYDTAILSD